MATKKTIKEKLVAPTRLMCTASGEEKNTKTGFYTSHSELYTYNWGKIPVCKDVIWKRFEVLKEQYMDDIKALYHLCMNFDIYFNHSLVLSAYEQSAKEGNDNLAKIYFQKVNSLPQYKGKTSLDSDIIILDESMITDVVTEATNSAVRDIVEEEEEFIVTREMKKFWGRGYTDEEYCRLQDSYKEWTDCHDDETLAQRKLFRAISILELEEEKARLEGNDKKQKDMSELISKKMGDANIKPTQKKALGEDNNETFGVFLEMIERDEPIPEPLPEFLDVDRIYYYIKEYFIKPFARVFGFADANNEGEITLHDKFTKDIEEGESNENSN